MVKLKLMCFYAISIIYYNLKVLNKVYFYYILIKIDDVRQIKEILCYSFYIER